MGLGLGLAVEGVAEMRAGWGKVRAEVDAMTPWNFSR
jgi:hypothetical protein